MVIRFWFWGLLACPELYYDWSLHNQHSWKFSGVHGFLSLTVTMLCQVWWLLIPWNSHPTTHCLLFQAKALQTQMLAPGFTWFFTTLKCTNNNPLSQSVNLQSHFKYPMSYLKENIRHFRNKKRTGAEKLPALFHDALVSYIVFANFFPCCY